jgi:hypothetical protein
MVAPGGKVYFEYLNIKPDIFLWQNMDQECREKRVLLELRWLGRMKVKRSYWV